MGDKSRGLYPEGKFIVQRCDGTDAVGDKHDGCDYFVLDLTHDVHAMPALRAYAASARQDGYEALADDLEQIAGAQPVTTTAARAAAEEIAKFVDQAQPLPFASGLLERDIAAIISKHFPSATVEAGGDEHCWHCGTVLTPAPRQRCEDCPEECDVENCDAFGCAALRNSEREGK